MFVDIFSSAFRTLSDFEDGVFCERSKRLLATTIFAKPAILTPPINKFMVSQGS